MNYIASNFIESLSLIAALTVYMWLMSISPLLRLASKIAALTAWGIISVGGVAAVVFIVYLPQHRYIEAAAAIVAGSILYVPWFLFGLPELAATIKSRFAGVGK